MTININRNALIAVVSAEIIIILMLITAIVAIQINHSSAGEDIALSKKLIPHAVAAHRGASFYAPENTLPAFALAREYGADYIECDLQRTSDGVPVIFHDADMSRTTDAAKKFRGREKDGIGTFSYSEVASLDAGTWFIKTYPLRARESYKGVRVSTLEECIDAAGNTALMIELKNPSLYPGIEQQTADMLRAKGRLRRAASGTPDMVLSFDIESLRRMRCAAPEIKLMYLVNSRHGKSNAWDSRGWNGLLDDAAAIGAEIGASSQLGRPWYNERAHRKDLIIANWTVDAKWQMRLLSFSGMDWVITNRCDLALDYYGSEPAETADEILTKLGF